MRNLSKDQTIKLLRVAYSLLKQLDEPLSVQESTGRDIYDFAMQHTTHKDIIYHEQSARKNQFDRLKTIQYLNFLLNLEKINANS